jgi:hypothetical protein
MVVLIPPNRATTLSRKRVLVGRNDVLDAKLFATDKNKLRKNIWGGTLGGPSRGSAFSLALTGVAEIEALRASLLFPPGGGNGVSPPLGKRFTIHSRWRGRYRDPYGV